MRYLCLQLVCSVKCIPQYVKSGSVGMADEQDSGSCVGYHVWVQVPSSALAKKGSL